MNGATRTIDKPDVERAIVDPATYMDRAAYDAIFTGLRRDDPIRWIEPEGFRPFWLVTRSADIVDIERRATIFLNGPRAVLKPRTFEERLARQQRGHSEIIKSMNNMDGEAHRANRAVTSRDFLRPNIERMAAQLEPVAADFVQRLVDKAPTCDFAADVTMWYPLRVILTLLGVAPEHDGRILALTQRIFLDPGDGADPAAAQADKMAAVEGFFDFFRPIVADRRANPRDDIASKVANARIDGEPMDEFETLSYFLTLATAGHDTTAASIAGGLLALIRNPGEMEKLRGDPGLLETAADEMIRWNAPVKHFFRTAAEDFEIGGKTIRVGDSVMLAFASACRDEDLFEDPFAFRVDRTPNRHLALGSGPHACLGQHLAKLEIRLFFRHLLDRIDHIELVGEPRSNPSSFISGIVSLPIRYRVRR